MCEGRNNPPHQALTSTRMRCCFIKAIISAGTDCFSSRFQAPFPYFQVTETWVGPGAEASSHVKSKKWSWSESSLN